jgi:tight adherence protein C
MTIFIGIVLVVLFGTAVAAAARAYAHPRTQAMARVREISAYGFHAEAVVSGTAPRTRRTSAFVSVGTRIGEFLDRGWLRGYGDWIRGRLIAAAMYDIASRTLIGLQFLGAAAVALLFVYAAPADTLGKNVMLALAAALIVWAAPVVYIHGRAARRLDNIERQVPDLIDMLVVTLEAGLGFGASMEVSSTRMRPPIGDEIRLTMQEQSMGLSMSEALTNMLERVETPNVSAFVRSVVQGNALGVSMGIVMRNLAADMRVRRRQQAEERAHKAPVKMLFPLIFLMFPALGVVILGPALFEIFTQFGNL